MKKICPNCGAETEGNFCPDCGTKHPIDSGAVFCGNCGAKLQRDASISIKYEGKGFGTPEEALTCYMEGLKNLDFEQMLIAFAWETQMAHYDFKAYFERTVKQKVDRSNTFCKYRINRRRDADIPMDRGGALPRRDSRSGGGAATAPPEDAAFLPATGV